MDPHLSEPVDQSLRRGAAWWTGMSLALVGFVGLCVWVAWSPAVDVEDFWPSRLWSRVLLALLAAFVALLVLVRIIYRSTPRDVAISDLTAEALRRLRPDDVLRFVGHAFAARGYERVDLGDASVRADPRSDIKLHRDGQSLLVRCCHWGSVRVDADKVELFGELLADCQMDGGFMVTTGRFSHAAVRQARGLNLTLVDGRLLQSLLAHEWPPLAPMLKPPVPHDEPQPSAGFDDDMPQDMLSQQPLASAFSPQPAPTHEPAAVVAPPTPACPRCASPMVLRVAKRGRRAGRGLWACSRGRSCKGVRPLV